MSRGDLARRLFFTMMIGICSSTIACGDPHDRGRAFRVIGHRGAAGHAPENTIPAVEIALELGVSEVELDVQLSRDGVLVLFHDATLDEKTDLSGRVRDQDAAILEKGEIGSWFDAEHPESTRRFAGTTLVRLDEVFRRFGRRPYYHLEIKETDPDVARLLLESIDRSGLSDRVMITSFQLEPLRRVRDMDPVIPICLLIEETSKLRVEAARNGLAHLSQDELQERQLDLAARRGFQMVAFEARELSRDLVEAAHARSLEIRAWGVRDEADVDRVLAVGADGMTVDEPDRVRARLR